MFSERPVRTEELGDSLYSHVGTSKAGEPVQTSVDHLSAIVLSKAAQLARFDLPTVQHGVTCNVLWARRSALE